MVFNDKTINILGEFSSDYSKKIYGREISRRLKMNQKTVSNTLNKLEKEHILKFSLEGKNKYYYINRFNPKIKEIIKLIEINKKVVFLDRHKRKRELFEKIESRANETVIVFGSYAKNQETEKSDLDLFVIGNISNLKDLELLYNIKINIIKSSAEKFSSKEHLIKEVISNHVILKGVETFIKLIW
jgi:predicted nucleotidyltransferase